MLLVLPVVLISGCATGDSVAGAGADVNDVGPRTTASEKTTPEHAVSPTAGSPTGVPKLRNALAQALWEHDPAAAATLTLEQRASAQDQLVVTWTVSKDPDDTSAKDRVRREAIAILGVAKLSDLSYGSVLLIADAAVRDGSGGKIDAKVVRAKYSRELIQRTDFAQVAPEKILTLPDDKPAEIHPAYR